MEIEKGPASNVSKVSGTLLVSKTDYCARVNTNRSKKINETEVIDGTFTPLKSVSFAIFSGLHHLYLRTNID